MFPSTFQNRRQRRFGLTIERLEDRHLLAGLQAGETSLQAAIGYLADQMDAPQRQFTVYQDVSSPGSHFFTYGKIPGPTTHVTINGSWSDNPHSGATAIRADFLPLDPFGGYYFQNGILTGADTVPRVNFGDVPNAGIDLTGATKLVLSARGQNGGERVEFFMFGVGYDPDRNNAQIAPYPDSSTKLSTGLVTLSNQWQQFQISIPAGTNLSYVLGGFGWVASSAANPTGATFYLDDIYYELNSARQAQRLNEPRFIRSFATAPVQTDPVRGDFDLRFRNSAFSYDNALAILAFLGEGSVDSLRRARLIGDAFVYALHNDRAFTFENNGWIRSIYAAGDLTVPPGWAPNGKLGTVASPGFYKEGEQRFVDLWFEGDDNSAIDVGNNAWVAISLTALFKRTGDSRYLDGAVRIGQFIDTQADSGSQYHGFRGGIKTAEGNPVDRLYSSTEHNLDVVAMAAALLSATGDVRWQTMANSAREFVLAMWDNDLHTYLTGTKDDRTRNPLPLPLDVQAWSVLALTDGLSIHPDVLDSALASHKVTVDGVTGVDFNEDKDGIWFEGTAQMAVALAAAGRLDEAQVFRATLQTAQTTSPFGQVGGIVAASHDGLTTGFGFKYFRTLHIGATAWLALAQAAFNPYYQYVVTWQNPRQPLDVDMSGKIIPFDVLQVINDLNGRGTRQLPLTTPTNHGPLFLDVYGDLSVTPLDALIIINYLNSLASHGMLAPQSASGQPDSGQAVFPTRTKPFTDDAIQTVVELAPRPTAQFGNLVTSQEAATAVTRGRLTLDANTKRVTFDATSAAHSLRFVARGSFRPLVNTELIDLVLQETPNEQ